MALLLIAVYVAAVVALACEGVRTERQLSRECRPWGEWR